jgi:nucleotidyltransferase/DNA polymerase involved in DNA repair
VGLNANFELYGDLSDRMMSVAAGLGPKQEIYSIDESFIGLVYIVSYNWSQKEGNNGNNDTRVRFGTGY